MSSDSVTQLSDLDETLKKCKKEVVDRQPLYVDDIDDCVNVSGVLGHSWLNVLTNTVKETCHLKARSSQNNSKLEGVKIIFYNMLVIIINKDSSNQM